MNYKGVIMENNITLEQFNAFRAVQFGGSFNMMSPQARAATGLSKDVYFEILQNYEALEAKYGKYSADGFKKVHIDWKRLAGDLLDRFVEVESPEDATQWLLLSGYTIDELVTLGFDKDAVELIDSENRSEGIY
jgi:hypothetical protein